MTRFRERERESIYLPHNITQMFRNNITEAGCQRGTDAYQCWLPLQLKSCNIGTRMQWRINHDANDAMAWGPPLKGAPRAAV